MNSYKVLIDGNSHKTRLETLESIDCIPTMESELELWLERSHRDGTIGDDVIYDGAYLQITLEDNESDFSRDFGITINGYPSTVFTFQVEETTEI